MGKVAKKATAKISEITERNEQLKFAKPGAFVVEDDFNLRSVTNTEADAALVGSIKKHGYEEQANSLFL